MQQNHERHKTHAPRAHPALAQRHEVVVNNEGEQCQHHAGAARRRGLALARASPEHDEIDATSASPTRQPNCHVHRHRLRRPGGVERD